MAEPPLRGTVELRYRLADMKKLNSRDAGTGEVTPAAVSNVTLARVRRQLRLYGITQEQVAHAHGVSRVMVTNMLARRTQSARLLQRCFDMIDEARRARRAARRSRR